MEVALCEGDKALLDCPESSAATSTSSELMKMKRFIVTRFKDYTKTGKTLYVTRTITVKLHCPKDLTERQKKSCVEVRLHIHIFSRGLRTKHLTFPVRCYEHKSPHAHRKPV